MQYNRSFAIKIAKLIFKLLASGDALMNEKSVRLSSERDMKADYVCKVRKV